MQSWKSGKYTFQRGGSAASQNTTSQHLLVPSWAWQLANDTMSMVSLNWSCQPYWTLAAKTQGYTPSPGAGRCRGAKAQPSGCHGEPLNRAIPAPRLLGESAEVSVVAAVRSLPLSRVGLRLHWAEGVLPLPESTGGFGEKQKTHRLSGHSGLNCDPFHPLQTLLSPSSNSFPPFHAIHHLPTLHYHFLFY